MLEFLIRFEANTGLLVARAVNVYSFSHLTFQEYLTAQQAMRKPSVLLEMAPHIGEPRWREVWILLSTMLDADDVAVETKVAVDLLVRHSSPIQQMLYGFLERDNKALGWRAFYCGLEVAIAVKRERVLERVIEKVPFLRGRPRTETSVASLAVEGWPIDVQVKSRQKVINRRSLLPIEQLFEEVISAAKDAGTFASRLGSIESAEVSVSIAVLNAVMRCEALDLVMQRFDCEVSDAWRVTDALHQAIQLARPGTALFKELHACRMEFAGSDLSREWFRKNYQSWLERLRAAAARYWGFGHTWGLADDDKKLLQQYYQANRLLVDCMDAAPALST